MKFPEVFINGRFLTHAITGVERTALETIKALDSLLDDPSIELNRCQFTLLAPSSVKNPLPLRHIEFIRCGILDGHLWEQFELPFYVGNRFLLNFCNTAPIFMKNQFVTIHDASIYAVPSSYSFMFRLWYRFMFHFLSRNAARILTDSEFSEKELIRFCGTSRNKVSVVYLGTDHISSVEKDKNIINRLGMGRKPYVFAVGSQNYHKNISGLIEAVSRLDPNQFDLVIAGNQNSKVFNKIKHKNMDRIIYTGRVTDGELHALYEGATCFVYPSFYEGFGLPPLESMACGCPVLVSNKASLPEVCGDAALYCDPYDDKDISEKIQLLLSDKELRQTMIKRGYEQASLFTWKMSALTLGKILNSICV